jgi:RecA-family ATPase
VSESTVVTRDERAKAIGSRFKTPKEMFARGEETITWLIPDFIPANALVSFQSRAKAGKSTLVFHMIRAMLEGGEFLGNKIEKQKVVYLTEQPRSTFLLQLREAGIKHDVANVRGTGSLPL